MCRSLNRIFACIVLVVLIFSAAACNLTTPQPTPVPTPDVPTVDFIYPENGSSVFEGIDMEVDILARDPASGIARIEFRVDGEKINEGQPPDGIVPEFRVKMNWLSAGIGGHTLSAVAYRLDGTASEENIIAIDVISR